MEIRITKTATWLLRLILLFAFLVPSIADAQEKKKKKTRYRMSLECQKVTNGERILTARLFYKEGPSFFNVPEETVTFFIPGEEEDLILANLTTDENGEAALHIAADYQYPWDEDRMCIFAARFEGNENARAADDELYITDVDINVDMQVVDEEQVVNVRVTKLDPEGNEVPVYEAEVYGYVERMFSDLPIGEDYSDEDGKLTFEFPENLPGDSLGNLTVVVRINESDEFGSVEMKKVIDWGTSVDFSEYRMPRALWTDEAPVWMSFAVIIILAGAWLNFLLAMYRLYKVKKLGETVEAETQQG
jgi:hypothetical protein